MAGRGEKAAVSLGPHSLSVTLKNRWARLAVSREGQAYVVALDDLAYWDEPHQAEEIAIEDLRTIVRAIEAEFARRGEEVDFE